MRVRWVLAGAAALFVVACGSGSPGGFPAAVRKPATPTTNTAAQGTPAPPPTSSDPAGDQRVFVTLARGEVTPSVKAVKAKRIAFVVSNDEEDARTFQVATTGGTPLVGLDAINPGAVGTLSVELSPGDYELAAGPAKVTFSVAAPETG